MMFLVEGGKRYLGNTALIETKTREAIIKSML